MPSFFRAADALLVTLKKDPIFAMTIPGKVQSYLAAGVPLLGMLDGEGARVIEKAEAGLTCPAGGGAELADRIRRSLIWINPSGAKWASTPRNTAGENSIALRCCQSWKTGWPAYRKTVF